MAPAGAPDGTLPKRPTPLIMFRMDAPERRDPVSAPNPPQRALPPKPFDLAGLPAISRLLVPLDGSPMAESALVLAGRLAEAFAATLVLLHVIERRASPRRHGAHHLTRREEAEAYLAQVASRLQADGRTVEWHTHAVPVGDVAESIATHADEHAIDLIVLSTHGEGGIRDALWGSIAQQVVEHTTRPVLLARAESPAATAPFVPQSIMVPLDGTAAAEAALPHAACLARGLGSVLRLVLVVPTLDTVSAEERATATFLPGASRLLLDVQEEQGSAYLDALAAATQAVGVRARAEVRRGEAVAQLATDTGEHADGLVVIATHGRAGLQAIWNHSVAARLLRRTQAPILLVPISE
jgi:nucleotide-binding universal stress UspA family protein